VCETPDFREQQVELLALDFGDEAPPVREDRLSLKFRVRAECYFNMMDEARSTTTMALSNVGRDRNSRLPHLHRQTVPFVRRESFGKAVREVRQIHGLLPDDEILKADNRLHDHVIRNSRSVMELGMCVVAMSFDRSYCHQCDAASSQEQQWLPTTVLESLTTNPLQSLTPNP